MVSLGGILDEAWRASLEVSHVLFMSWFLVTKCVQLMKFNSAVHLWFVHFSVHILPNIYFWKCEFDLKIWITFQDVSLSEKCKMWEFPVVQWLGLGSFTAKDLGSIPGWELWFHKPHWAAKQKKKKWINERKPKYMDRYAMLMDWKTQSSKKSILQKQYKSMQSKLVFLRSWF